MLKVNRKQIPLTPAFAMTAHSSQGKTLPAVILDLNIDKRTDANLGTVAASRVRDRRDVLILRPFPLWLFQRGAPDGIKLLLQTLRGQKVDWRAHQGRRKPASNCQKCKELRVLDQFAEKQWDLARANLPATCLLCQSGANPHKNVKRKYTTGPAEHLCSGCKYSKIEAAFPRAQLEQTNAAEKQRCIICVKAQEILTCVVCRTMKEADLFKPTLLTFPEEFIVCIECQSKQSDLIDTKQGAAKPPPELKKRSTKGWFKCRGCAEYLLQKARKDPFSQRCVNCASRNNIITPKRQRKC